MDVIGSVDRMLTCSVPEVNLKKKKLSGDERLHRNRERNRMHARKTRERKKQQSNTLQTRISELQEEGIRLRQIVDDRYTASVLLGLSQTFQDSAGENHNIISSVNICQNAYAVALAENNWFGEGAATGTPTVPKRIRRRGKYTPQERERIRRERNRMHAKRTRDRKKQLLEVSESMIGEMENESHSLREYLVSLKLISVEEAEKSEERASESKKELAALKASQSEYDLDGDDDDDDDHFNDDNGDGDDEHDNDGSLSGSDDNEKGSWNGSNNGNDSINGDTSGDGTASTGSNNSSSHNAPSSSGSSRSHHSSGSGSGSGGDSPAPKHASMDWGKEQEAPCLFNYGTKPSGGFKPPVIVSHVLPSVHANGVVYAPRAAGAKKLQSVENYNHGGVVPVNEEAKAVEKATYLVYSLQQAQAASATPSTSALTLLMPPASPTCASSASPPIYNSVLLTQEINATLTAANYYQGQMQQESMPLQGWHYPLIRPASQLSLKVPNLVMSVIPQGILAPPNSGACSPRGTFSPIEMNQGKLFATQAHSPSSRAFGGAFSAILSNSVKSEVTNSNALGGFVDINQYPVFQRDSMQYRNLPSSNLANGNSPL